MNGGVLEFGCSPVAEHRPVLFGDFATDVVNRVEKKYFSHKFIYNLGFRKIWIILTASLFWVRRGGNAVSERPRTGPVVQACGNSRKA